MNIDVEELLLGDDDEYISFLNRLGHISPSVLAYHYPFYRDMLVEIGVGQPVYLGARLNGKLVGVLPAFTRESTLGIVYSSLPYFGPNAGVLYSDSEARAEIHTALLQALLSRAEQDKALSCSVYTPFLFDEFQLYDAAMPDALVVDKFTQYLDLKTVPWGKEIAYDSKEITRNLRKAKRRGVAISKDITPERVEAFFAIYERNCNDHGIPLKPRKCLEFLVGEGIRSGHADIYFAFHEGEMVAGFLVIWSPLTASYYMSCILTSAKSLQAHTALIDQAIQDARARGIQIWNWESSPSRELGVYRFKKQWGSVEASYRIYVQAFHTRDKFQRLGRDGILGHFPFFFVYPFDLL